MNKILYPSQKDYLLSFIKEDADIIKEMEVFAKEHNVPILSKESSLFLEQMILLTRPKRVLEIGTAIGYSSIKIARNLKKKSVIHTIEKSQDNINLAKDFIERAGLTNKIVVMEGEAFNVMPRLEKKYDFIFLDADKEDYKRLLDYSLVLLKTNGVLFVDNLLWHGFAAARKIPADYRKSTQFIREFNKEFMSHSNLKASIIPVGDGIGIGIKI